MSILLLRSRTGVPRTDALINWVLRQTTVYETMFLTNINSRARFRKHMEDNLVVELFPMSFKCATTPANEPSLETLRYTEEDLAVATSPGQNMYFIISMHAENREVTTSKHSTIPRARPELCLDRGAEEPYLWQQLLVAQPGLRS
ncbi:hypothetical protein IEO21_03601 [Rhodonia placenta]|uniref:Uncharacterized protein n=1 Tax=Rhodonia placenta TaxID=104341 RepID=A0A8H7P5K2_9APHY|nr:hypothetical protein IEO21_03601 [Postia placenta]